MLLARSGGSSFADPPLKQVAGGSKGMRPLLLLRHPSLTAVESNSDLLRHLKKFRFIVSLSGNTGCLHKTETIVCISGFDVAVVMKRISVSVARRAGSKSQRSASPKSSLFLIEVAQKQPFWGVLGRGGGWAVGICVTEAKAETLVSQGTSQERRALNAASLLDKVSIIVWSTCEIS